MDNTELKPCPFCGGRAEVKGASQGRYIKCRGCGCRTGKGSDLQRLADIWNRRAEEEKSIQQRISELEGKDADGKG